MEITHVAAILGDMSRRRKRKAHDPFDYRRKDKRTAYDWFERRARDLRASASPAEVALWERLRMSRTGHLFHWNYPYQPYILDFVCFNSAVIVEVDGAFHAERQAADEERDWFFARKGVKVMRFMARDVVADPDAVVALIVRACDDRKGIPSAF